MKRIVICLVVMACLISGSAAAEVALVGGTYTDVTSMMTHDALIEFAAEEPCEVGVLEPDEKTLAMLEDIYAFVWKDANPPVRYYDEETQQKIQALVPDADIDLLHMTEFMSLQLLGVGEDKVELRAFFDVDYRPGQLIVVVLSEAQEDGTYRYFPYRGEVEEQGVIRFEMPAEEFVALTQRPLVFHVLADRTGGRGGVVHREVVEEEPVVTPSKSAQDLTQIYRWRSENGEPIEDTFSIFLVDNTPEMREEIARIGEFLAMEKQPGEQPNAPIDYFPEEIRKQAQPLHSAETDVSQMLIYDVVALMAKDYKDTYGDVATESLFASAYSPERSMFALLGFPNEETKQQAGQAQPAAAEEPEAKTQDDAQEAQTQPAQIEQHFDWYCLRAETLEEAERVEVVFKQLVIPKMEKEPAMLMIFSEPIEIEEEEKVAE